MIVLGPFFIILVVGFFFFCAVISLAACAASREPELDELDFDNAHPDGFIRHFAADKREVL